MVVVEIRLLVMELTRRFLCIKDSGGVPSEQSGTTYTGTGSFHIKDVVVTAVVPANETKSETVGSEGY